jgi:methionine aminopeptidase
MTLAIEPMINLGGPACACWRWLDSLHFRWIALGHFEHTVLITKDEPEILTWRAKTQLK